jgi:hypothetical protein
MHFQFPLCREFATFSISSIDLFGTMMRIVFLEIIAISSIYAIEDPIPSSFLQPRDFNPHPYQEDPRGFVYSPTGGNEYQNLPERDFAPLIRRYLE